MSQRYVLLWGLAVALVFWHAAAAEPFPRPETDAAARIYQCYRVNTPPAIDGRLDEPAWNGADSTEDFVDIRGSQWPAPSLRTLAKLCWDDTHLYIAATLEEQHLQASCTEHDAYIYQFDNDFEVFIDPDGDTHNYFELEMNALNTVWDLLLTKPYRDGGLALDGWDFKGLQTAVALAHTLNDPADVDSGWTVEIAIPWRALAEAAGTACPPAPGDYWRLNFSRVEWRFENDHGEYVKVVDPDTGDAYSEDNWVWSPPGLISMHYPERWGYLLFLADEPDPELLDRIGERDAVSQILYDVYYLQRDYFAEHGAYALFIADLRWNEQRYATAELRPLLSGDGQHYQVAVELPSGGSLWLDETGRSWLQDGWD
ncbi:carbohydrate-binding family 9-like protein [bacterium]|nr:carbohydrate-binding family 9-like protein [bacterium]